MTQGRNHREDAVYRDTHYSFETSDPPGESMAQAAEQTPPPGFVDRPGVVGREAELSSDGRTRLEEKSPAPVVPPSSPGLGSTKDLAPPDPEEGVRPAAVKAVGGGTPRPGDILY